MRYINKTKVYSLTEVANLLSVHRLTIYHWFKRGWVKAKRDCCNRPVFTEADIKNIKKWRNTIRD